MMLSFFFLGSSLGRASDIGPDEDDYGYSKLAVVDLDASPQQYMHLLPKQSDSEDYVFSRYE